MTIRVRTPRPDESDAFERAVGLAFNDELSEAELEHGRRVWEPERDLAAFDGAQIVGTAGSYGFRLSVPGGELPCAGVTVVTVIPSHRRRGVLTRMMHHQLRDVHERGEPIAALWASEAAIYGRFGYGLATRNARIDADRDRVAIPGARIGRVELVDTVDALRLLPRVYERARRFTAGFPSRSRAWWEHEVLVDLPEQRHGGGPLRRAVFVLDGRPQGYALYRLEHQWNEGFPAGTLRVEEEVSLTPAATREMWCFLFGVDLVARVRSRALPPDHPIFLLVAEPARLRFRLGDGLFVRLVDLPSALVRRAYAGEGAVVLGVTDELCPWNTGRWHLEAGAGEAAARPSRRAAELVLGIREFGSAYLGGTSFSELARAGLLEERRRGAAARADALFRTERAPWCPGTF